MARTVVGMFRDFNDAQEAVHDLIKNGVDKEQISIVANDANSHFRQAIEDLASEQEGVEGAVKGMEIGATLGGIAGLLVGLGAFTIPGIGPVIAAGPLIATLGGVGIGAVTGGMIGALVDAGVPESHAGGYMDGVKKGGTLVVVSTTDRVADTAANILNQYHAIDIHEESSIHQGGSTERNWKGFNENSETFAFDTTPEPYHDREARSELDYGPGARTYLAGQGIDEYDQRKTDLGNYQNYVTTEWMMYEPRFRQDFYSRYAAVGGRWEDFEELYRFGFERAHENRFRDHEWEVIQNDMRREWEKYKPDRQWDEVQEVIRTGFTARKPPEQ